jgi:hypothetical protein
MWSERGVAVTEGRVRTDAPLGTCPSASALTDAHWVNRLQTLHADAGGRRPGRTCTWEAQLHSPPISPAMGDLFHRSSLLFNQAAARSFHSAAAPTGSTGSH